MQKWAIGVDLGGTKIEIAIVSAQGRLLDRLRIPTESAQSPGKIIDKIKNAIETLCKQHQGIDIETIGIGVAGQVKKDTGIISYAPNLGWHNIDLQAQLESSLHKPVAVCNDVRAAGWGEWQHGAGVGCDNMVCIFVGTGVGGAIIANGKMLEGCDNAAGEIGHMTIQLHGPLCRCGNTGCLEALAGGWAMERDVQLAVQKDKEGGKMLLEIAKGDIKAISGQTVAAAAQKDDAMAKRLVRNMTDALTAGVISIVNTLGPCRVILGGGVVEGMPGLVADVEKEVKKYALKAAAATLEVLPAKLHNDSGVVGAATFALHKLKNTKV